MNVAVFIVWSVYCSPPLCHNQVVTRGCRIQSHPSPTESVPWHNDCYDNHHLKPRVGGGEMSASRLLLWWSHFWLAGTTRSKHPNWQSGCRLHANDKNPVSKQLHWPVWTHPGWGTENKVGGWNKRNKNLGSKGKWDIEGGMAVFGRLWAQSLAVRAKWGF